MPDPKRFQLSKTRLKKLSLVNTKNNTSMELSSTQNSVQRTSYNKQDEQVVTTTTQEQMEVLAMSSPSQKSIESFQKYLHKHGRMIRNNSDSLQEPLKPDSERINKITVGEWSAETERFRKIKSFEEKKHNWECDQKKLKEAVAKSKKDDQERDVENKVLRQARDTVEWLDMKVKQLQEHIKLNQLDQAMEGYVKLWNKQS